MDMVRKESESKQKLAYMSGFGGHFSSESLPGSLPTGQNSPQVCPYGLYAEQLSGSAFTAPRQKNCRSWLYRIRPSVCQTEFNNVEKPFHRDNIDEFVVNPNATRWNPMPLIDASDSKDFIDGLVQICGSGDPSLKEGLCIYNFVANKSMTHKAMCFSDGDVLIVPQLGTLTIKTEMGIIQAEPCEIVVIQRGIKFSVSVNDVSRGYMLEVFKGHFELPSLGPIGANGLANPRDFETPVAAFEDIDVEFRIVNKFMGKLFETALDHSPFDVVAWHGNYAPYKYDLRKFCCINSVSFDHPDPSIYTVLTCPSDEPGTAVADFVIFPPRWMVMEHTFRPPYYVSSRAHEPFLHRNCMSEYMGMIYGEYDAKKGGAGGFVPGGASLHSCMTPHGPDEGTFLGASAATLRPTYFAGGLAFMFESCYLLKVSPEALYTDAEEDTEVPARGRLHPTVQKNYTKCWKKLPKIFDGSMNPAFPLPLGPSGFAAPPPPLLTSDSADLVQTKDSD